MQQTIYFPHTITTRFSNLKRRPSSTFAFLLEKAKQNEQEASTIETEVSLTENVETESGDLEAVSESASLWFPFLDMVAKSPTSHRRYSVTLFSHIVVVVVQGSRGEEVCGV